MTLFEHEHGSIAEANRRDLGSLGEDLPWVEPEKAERAREERERLLEILRSRTVFGFRGTKVDAGNLSPGCRICGEGTWSCLFINGLCNGRCFYCPSEQKSRDVPMTSTVPFPDPRDYIAYLERFGFRGVSISGGEPLLTLDRTLTFVTKIRRHFGPALYIWLYTNGLLTNGETLRRLRDAGIDEVRFNIGAGNYRLDPVREAVGIIPAVTVEIPAVPEKEDLLCEKIGEMADSGVNFLNLHQIRCTPFNGKHLLARNYTLLHGPRVAVLESELTALRILARLRERGIDFPVNYCSSIYRSRFQTAGARRRNARVARKSWEDITEAGLIRSLSLEGSPEWMARIAEDLRAGGVPPGSWTLSGKGRLLFSGDLRPRMDLSGGLVKVSYTACTLHPAVTYRNPYLELPLTRKKSVVIERSTVARDIPLSPGEIDFFERQFLHREPPPSDGGKVLKERAGQEDNEGSDREKWGKIFESEALPYGLSDYY